MPKADREYSFVLVLDGPEEPGPEAQDALYEAGCDDAILVRQNGATLLDFDREAPSLREAVVSAIRDVERAGFHVVRVELGDLVSASEIAQRLHRSRECIRLYARGDRGPGSFPAPTARAKSRTPLYSWGDIERWASRLPAAKVARPGKRSVTASGSTLYDSRYVDVINAALVLRREGPGLPEAGAILEGLGLELVAISGGQRIYTAKAPKPGRAKTGAKGSKRRV